MTIICFELSMPNNNAWNGRWRGEGRCYARTKNLGRTKKAEAKATKLIADSCYYYKFGDGWGASVSVLEVTPAEAAKMRRKVRRILRLRLDDRLDHDGEILVKPRAA